MLTPKESALIQEYISIDGDGNVVGNDNTVQITKVKADTYVVQKDQRQVTVTVQDLRHVFNIEHSQIGVVGDHATIYGGVHFHNPPASTLPPLSKRSPTSRFQHDHPLVGRDKKIAWLQQLEGDGLVVGQPGSGKTFLLQQIVSEGNGLFVASHDQEAIAAFLEARCPQFLIVDDAQVQTELLSKLKHIRTELDCFFQILATCWPGDEEELRSMLMLSESNICRLGLLTRDEMVEVIQATGVAGPNRLVREIVNQAEGRPGLATTLAYLSMQGDVHQVISGDALKTSLLEILKTEMGQPTQEILAAFALGGDAGMTLETVADQLNLSLIDVRQSVVELAAGGVIQETNAQNLSVRPPALRHVLVRDVFFCGAAALPLSVLQNLLEDVPSLAESAQVLIGAKARGADIPSPLLINLIENTYDAGLWRLYVQLGREEATWVLKNHPEELDSIAPFALESAPDVGIPLLLTHAIGDERPLHSHPAHPIRRIKDWVLAGRPGSGQPLKRRRALLQSVRLWLQQGSHQSTGLRALRFVLSPNFEHHTSDPGAGNTFTIRRGHLLVEELHAVQDLCPPVLEILHNARITDWTPVRGMVEDWVYPRRFNRRSSSEVSDVIQNFAVQLLRDLIPLIESHPGLCRWAGQISGHLELDFQIPKDQVFEMLYPLEDMRDVEQWETVQSQQRRAVLELAHRWTQRDPVKVVQDLAQIEEEARLVDIRWPRWTGLLCQEIADGSSQPDLWARSILETNLPSDCIAPFLRQTITRNIPSWDDLVVTCFQHPVFYSVAVSLILTHPDPPDHLLSQALTTLEGLAEMVKVHCFRKEISVPVLKQLLRHPNRQIVSAVVDGEWNADPKGSVREAVLQEWEEAVVTDVTEDYWLGKIFKKRPSLAYPWLKTRLQEGLPFCFTHNWKQAVQNAVSVLDAEARSRLLCQLPEDQLTGEAVIYLVGDNLEVYKAFLDDKRYTDMHLLPLSRPPTGTWTDMAKLVLAAGYNSADIVRAIFWTVGVRVEKGPESKRWEVRVKRFKQLCEHEDAQIREIGRVGLQQAEEMLQRVLERERNEAIYGR